jgi:hypothetical protein
MRQPTVTLELGSHDINIVEDALEFYRLAADDSAFDGYTRIEVAMLTQRAYRARRRLEKRLA